MPNFVLTDEYDEIIDTLKMNSFSSDKADTALLTKLKMVLSSAGPEATHAKVLDDLRDRCVRGGWSKFWGAKKDKEAEGILGIAGGGSKKNKKAAALKTLRHLRLLNKFGAQDVWMLQTPKSYSGWPIEEMDGASKSTMKTKLNDITEYHTKKEIRDLAAATVNAIAWAQKAAVACSSAKLGDDLVKRWFADEDDHGESRLTEIRKELSRGYQSIASGATSGKLILSELPTVRGQSHEQSEAVVAKAERINVIYIESDFFGNQNTLTGMTNWARILIHELSHRMLKTDDVETHGNPRYAWHPRGIGPMKGSYSTAQAMKNADNWGWFACDAAGQLSQKNRNDALLRPGIT